MFPPLCRPWKENLWPLQCLVFSAAPLKKLKDKPKSWAWPPWATFTTAVHHDLLHVPCSGHIKLCGTTPWIVLVPFHAIMTTHGLLLSLGWTTSFCFPKLSGQLSMLLESLPWNLSDQTSSVNFFSTGRALCKAHVTLNCIFLHHN